MSSSQFPLAAAGHLGGFGIGNQDSRARNADGGSMHGGMFHPGASIFSKNAVASDESYLPVDDAPPRGMPIYDAFGAEPAAMHFGASYVLLERQRPDVASLARFAHRVELATFHMCVAFEQAGIRDFYVEFEAVQPKRRAKATWFAWLADSTFSRFRVLRQALMYEWTPPADVEGLTYSAFHSLCDLTPASSHSLKQLFFIRRAHAIKSLVKQLDLTAGLIQDALALAADAEHGISDKAQEDDASRLEANQAQILAHAGETLGLREAAARLGMSHQNLHKRVGSGSALGVMRDREIIVPAIQFFEDGGSVKIVPELRRVLSVFEESRAGNWSALQFLVELDPMLGAKPIDVLKSGQIDSVVRSARAYLGLDES
ncbi:hypothetical protein LAV84_27685 [Rhizobium sp. VS19-DR104.2]|uniref:hypothetical protein n=1 Tax=unclassified Rhizobium TaxID=2613769 RepID=UPI001CC7D226|nr:MULTISPECIES: hypothetical protein [unclassified Rhizobium]MBZ5763037.1 hypothetical protein [Rhizobium sp. VS19-DR96]MBZ5768816.1 hypothetical protein [Rhizobium sp. VS19-DR129.2]MBZ5776345.1 hypothetical protein [Rhizobium sp. VS19-DRK62.2]MBZ5787553.1 hypothetical protein [Rhizobium sp. VS19-DR121]MBZ5804908.1 hypothetical protein [Rhizobium sp. VS19-DR181]